MKVVIRLKTEFTMAKILHLKVLQFCNYFFMWLDNFLAECLHEFEFLGGALNLLQLYDLIMW